MADYLDDPEEDDFFERLHIENKSDPISVMTSVDLRQQIQINTDAILGLQELVTEIQASIEAMNELILKIAMRLDVA